MQSGLVTDSAVVNDINARIDMIPNGIYYLNLWHHIGRGEYSLDAATAVGGALVYNICTGTRAECESMAKGYHYDLVASFVKAHWDILSKQSS